MCIRDRLDPREEIDAEQETDEVDDLKFFLELLKLIRLAINAGTNVPQTKMCIRDRNSPAAIPIRLRTA